MSNRQQNEQHSAGLSETTGQQKALYQPSGPTNLLRMQYLLTTLLRARAALLGRCAAAGGGGERSRELHWRRAEAFPQPGTWSHAKTLKKNNKKKPFTGLQCGWGEAGGGDVESTYTFKLSQQTAVGGGNRLNEHVGGWVWTGMKQQSCCSFQLFTKRLMFHIFHEDMNHVGVVILWGGPNDSAFPYWEQQE